MKTIISLFFVLTLAGCSSSSPYTYHVEPTPLKSHETKYSIKSIVVNLELGEQAIAGDKSFATQEQLKKQLETALITRMKDAGIYAEEIGSTGFAVNLNVNYKRNINIGGKSLHKPHVSHSIVVVDAKKNKLASISRGRYTTGFGGFTGVAVDLEIAAFSWDAEDEPRDIDMVSKAIVDDLVELGS